MPPITIPTGAPKTERLSVSVDYTLESGPFDKGRWLNGSVGGYGPMENLNWFPGAYERLAALGFRMIRIDHLTDDTFYRVVSRQASGRLQFDFTRIDRIILPMLEKGIMPFMCLSYTPEALAPQDPKEVVADLGEWQQVVRAYVQHYTDLGYTGWYWEIWNEPDLAMFFKGSPQRYLEIYDKSVQAVKEVDPTARVGGPADADPVSSNARLAPLLEHVRAHPEIPLDFISYHKYSDPDYDGKPPYELDWNYKNVSLMLEFNKFSDVEIFITEWNLSGVMDAAPGADPDTHVGAAADAVRMFKLIQYPKITAIFFFSPLEGFSPQKVFNGDLGLLTVNYHKKAAYNLFQMYTCLGENLLSAQIEGPNTADHASYALATRDTAAQKAAVLVWNYRQETTPLHLRLSNLPYAAAGKNFKLNRYLIDADHANYYKDYAAGLRGYPVGPTEELQPVESRILHGTDAFQRQETLSPNSISLYLFEPNDSPPTGGAVEAASALPNRNLAAFKPVTASNSDPGAGWGPDWLVDEITHSLPGMLGWSSTAATSDDRREWVMVDFGAAVRVDAVKLYPCDSQDCEGGGFPLDFTIQAALEPDRWADLVTQENYGAGQPVYGVQAFTFPAVECRYLRVLATRLGAAAGEAGVFRFQLAELEAYGPADAEGN
ncbi:MAG: GH39 family glycosyl hydrolase [Chloroflexota bacterium]